MEEIQEYKCLRCGGAIAFDSTLQKMKCPYCDTEFEMAALARYDNELKNDQPDELNWEEVTAGEWQDGETDGLRSYVCKSCGGEIACDENTAATSCPYCGNPVVMTGQFTGAQKPDYVIPFQLDKKAAKQALYDFYVGKRLLPKAFKDENHVNEIKGVYVPFWLFDAKADVNLRYKATKIRTWSDSKYYYAETNHFLVSRSGSIEFAHVPVDGSAKMPDDLMETLEPFDFSGAVDFQTAYLAGYLADKYDVDSEESIGRANERIQKSVRDIFDMTVCGYTTFRKEAGSIRLHNGKVTYALFPVWLLSTTWNGQNYLFAMNGQNGKMAGDLPLDKGAYLRWLLGLTGITGTMLFILFYVIWLI